MIISLVDGWTANGRRGMPSLGSRKVLIVRNRPLIVTHSTQLGECRRRLARCDVHSALYDINAQMLRPSNDSIEVLHS